jgi:acyl carrier protein
MAAESPVAGRIRKALADYLKRDAGSITPQQSLRDDLGLDSMATIELLFRIEEAFDLQIPDTDLPGLVSVGHVIAYVEKRLQPPASARKPAGKRPGKQKK